LAQEFKTLDNLLKARLEDFDAIYEVGPIMAESIVEFFKQSSTRELIRKVKNAGLNLEERVTQVKKSALTGKTLVFTGELKDYSRTQAEELVRKRGGDSSLSVSKNTDFVVIGENPGSKYDKAKRLNIKIINEKEFSRLLASL